MKKQDLSKTMENFVNAYLSNEEKTVWDCEWVCAQLSFCLSTGIINDKEWHRYFAIVNSSL